MNLLRSTLDILEFISTVSSPIGPEVFAGYGNAIQAKLVNSPFEIEEVMKGWIIESNMKELLEELFHIFKDFTLPAPYLIEWKTYRQEWEYTILFILYTLVRQDIFILEDVLKQLKEFEMTKGIVDELLIWLQEEM